MKRRRNHILLILLAALLASVLLPGAAVPEGAGETDTRIARLHVHFDCGCEGWRSGTMVSKVGMITPSGTFYCPEHGNEFEQVVFYFGWKGNDEAFYIYDGDFNFCAYETFPKGYVNTNDIAYIQFPYSIGDKTGWYTCKAASDKELKNATVTIRDVAQDGAAYDFTDKASVKGEKLIRWARNENDRYATYGPPVFLTQQDGEKVMVAIHTSHDNKYDFCRRITKRVYEDMTKAGVFTDDPGLPPEDEEPAAAQDVPEGAWTCEACGHEGNTESFCTNCGAKKPDAGPWTCEACGHGGNTQNFCTNCGARRPQ